MMHELRILTELILSLHLKVDKMSLDTANLTAAVAAESTVIASAVTAINGIPALVAAAVAKALADAGIDDTTAQAAVDAATTQATADAAALTSALTANTPAPAPAGGTTAPVSGS